MRWTPLLCAIVVFALGAAAPTTCIVCGKTMIGAGDVTLLHRGREIAICGREPCWSHWVADPDRYFRTVQARAALFDEEAMEGRQISIGWIVFGFYMLAGTVVGACCAYLAIARGLPPLRWFFLGVSVNVVALLALLPRRGDTTGLPQGVPTGLRKVPRTYAPRRCPSCERAVHPAATSCRSCGAALQASVEAEIGRV